MRTRLCFTICVAAAAIFAAGCSSDAVVSSDERASESATPDEPVATAEADAADSDPVDDDDPADRDRGSRANADDTDDADTDETDDPDDPDDPDDEGAVELDDGEGFGLGGAEQLDGLLDDCDSGSDLACDILFQISSFDSAEEAAALSCGGRSEVELPFCTEGIDALPGELVFDPDSEGLDDIISLCEDDGDMTACDFLYYRSPLDSAFEEIGATCGGRVTVALPDCRTLLAESDNG